MEVLKHAAMGLLLGAISGAITFTTRRAMIRIADAVPIANGAEK